MHDIELNPGPEVKQGKVTLTVITLNCRGLGSTDKFRLLLNKMYDYMKKGELIVMLQETMVINENYLNLAWRGKYVFTPGTGNSQGCVTLTNSASNIEHIYHIGHRGHYFMYNSENLDPTLIMNIYAPTGFNADKFDFFTDAFNTLSNYDCDVLLAGDMNITLRQSDRHCRGVTEAEEQIAEHFKDFTNALNLRDVWYGKNGYTWQKGKTQSKLDRILYRVTKHKMKTLKTDWTIIKSDHAAVIAQFEHCERIMYKSSHVKLENDILKNPEMLNELRSYLILQLNDAHARNFNPHTKLEFAKMTLRTKALDLIAKNKKKVNERLVELNKDINNNMRIMASQTDANLQNMLLRETELLKLERDNILEQQGQKLASLAKTKWYNEGEKSNKYFLNMLKRQQSRSEMDCLIINGIETKDPKQISEHVQHFYQELYNHNRRTEIDPTFLSEMFVVDAHQNETIDKEITLQELWQTLRSLKATTPGPDGISNSYLKKMFDILGPLIVDAWKYSLAQNTLMMSHQKSLLRLIPKPGKDKRELKNWRPITLSNCDHKLITKTYNNRLLRIINNYITPTQTAYIKGRNISDNLRLLNSLTKNSALSNDAEFSVIALDAQKAFDSVNHDYIAAVLNKIGLVNFTPIFRLLYKNLENDVLINGQIGTRFTIKNGVKQGDALSCSLFILAVEPVLRNMQANDRITAVKCNRLNFTWPKVLAYADDISVITANRHSAIQAIFTEYERLSNASGLFLNADKTELFNITSPNAIVMQQHNVSYAGQNYDIYNSISVKINGIIFNNDSAQMAEDNFNLMFDKMTKHFIDWSKRHLSILGKIQIIKTFGLSQYLYSLAIIDFLPEHWKEIRKAIAKFIWNKTYAGNRAPNRFSNDILFKSIDKGGFGMLELEKVVEGLRIKRAFTLLEKDIHPINQLQIKLGLNEFLRKDPVVKIDAPTQTAMTTTAQHNLKCINNYDIDELEFDRLFRIKLCHTKIINIIGRQRRNNRLLAQLRHMGVLTVHEAINTGPQALNLLRQICVPELREIIHALNGVMHIDHRAQTPLNVHIYNELYRKWDNITTLKSNKIRAQLKEDTLMMRTKKLSFENCTQANQTFKKIKNIRSTALKTKMLRLVHGDVYCGTKLVRFKLSEIDTCIRCFAAETLDHLISECPYSKQVWSEFGIADLTLSNILNPDISNGEFEIRASLLETVVFRKQVTPPEIVLANTFSKYARGLGTSKKTIDFAKMKNSIKSTTGRWY